MGERERKRREDDKDPVASQEVSQQPAVSNAGAAVRASKARAARSASGSGSVTLDIGEGVSFASDKVSLSGEQVSFDKAVDSNTPVIADAFLKNTTFNAEVRIAGRVFKLDHANIDNYVAGDETESITLRFESFSITDETEETDDVRKSPAQDTDA